MSRPFREDQPPNPYPLSPSAQALNDFLNRGQASLDQVLERAKAGVSSGVGAAAGAVMNAIRPDEEQARRQAAAQALWLEKLRALREERAQPGILEQMLTQLRGPQMPAAIPRGSLAEVLNAQRVANPNPSVTPPPLIGVRN